MKRDFSHTFIDILTAEPLREGPEGKEIVMTLGIVGARALLAIDDPRKEETPAEQKVKDFQLATRIIHGGMVDITVEEAARLKTRIARAFGAIIVGQAFPLLDDDPPTEKSKDAK